MAKSETRAGTTLKPRDRWLVSSERVLKAQVLGSWTTLYLEQEVSINEAKGCKEDCAPRHNVVPVGSSG